MKSETVAARDLAVGDVVRIDDQDGWWEIVAIFNEAGHVLDIDLIRTDEGLGFEWFIGLEHRVQRAV